MAAVEDVARLAPVRFDAAALPTRERLEQWRARTETSYELVPPPELQPQDFNTRTSLWDLGPHLMNIGDYTPMTSIRSAALARADQFDHYVLRMNLLRPGAQLDADGRRLRLDARQPVLTEMTRPATFISPGGPGIVVFLPRAALAEALPRQVDLHGVVPQGACSALLVDHLEALSARLGELTPDEAQGAAAATVSLLAASLLSIPQTLAQARPAMEETLLRQVCRFIEEELCDPELSVPLICSSFRLSRATLYRIFEPLGGVAQHIRERRLKRIHASLAQPDRPVRQIVAIAEAHGFTDAVHFSRAFRQHFGYSPRDVRPQSGSGTTAAPVDSHVKAYHARIRSLQR